MRGFALSLGLVVLGSCVVECQENQRSPWDRTSDTLCFDGPGRAGWEIVNNQAPWQARTGHGSVSFQQMLYVIGGRSVDGTLLSDMWQSIDGREWQASSAVSAWTGRYRFGVVNMNNKIWILGGIIAPSAVGGSPYVSNEVWSLSSDGSSWDQIVTHSNVTTAANSTSSSSAAPPAIWAPRHSMVSVVFLGRIWLISGVEALVEASAAKTEDFRHDIWSTVDGVNWKRELERTPWGGRRTAVGAMYQLRIYVLAESADYRYYYNVWGSSNGISWSEPPASCAVSGQRVADALVIESGLVIIGAVDGLETGNASASFWYSPPGGNFNGTFLKSASSVATGARLEASYAAYLGRLWQTGGFCPACADGNKAQTFSDVQSSGSLAFTQLDVGKAASLAHSAPVIVACLLLSLCPLVL